MEGGLFEFILVFGFGFLIKIKLDKKIFKNLLVKLFMEVIYKYNVINNIVKRVLFKFWRG